MREDILLKSSLISVLVGSGRPPTFPKGERVISDFYLKFWAKYLCFHHDDPRVAAVPEVECGPVFASHGSVEIHR
jgi:hypothetical protein